MCSVVFYKQFPPLPAPVSELTWILGEHIECNSSVDDRITYVSYLHGYWEFVFGNYLQVREEKEKSTFLDSMYFWDLSQ